MHAPFARTVPVSPGAAERPLRLRRDPRPEEVRLMRELPDGRAAVLAGPIGRCCKRGWCRAVLLEAAIERRKEPALFELTAAGWALIVAWL